MSEPSPSGRQAIRNTKIKYYQETGLEGWRVDKERQKIIN